MPRIQGNEDPEICSGYKNMKSAQRRNRLDKIKVNKYRLNILVKIVVPVFIILVSLFILTISTKFWSNNNKTSFVFQKQNGDVGVTIFDPVLTELTTLVIPADTQVDVARNYGQLRIKNVWQLGINEKLRGSLLAQTVTRDFLFPTYLWSGLDLSNPWKFLVTSKNTNIPFGDRLKMVLFSVKVKGIDKNEIDLGKSQFLKKQILTDGETGYTINGTISGRLTVYFADNYVSNNNLKFAIIDSTSSYGIATNVGSILEVLGGKVVSVDRRSSNTDLDCKIYGKDLVAIKSIKNIFGCTTTSDKTDFDIVLELGGKFVKRF